MGQEKRITLTDGAGGEKMMEFIRRFVLANFGGNAGEIPLGMLDDSAIIDGIAFTTDSYVVKPLFFPGGNIGSLAISGTVNDLSVMGATPIALSCALILSDGFPLEDLDKILHTMREVATKAKVSVVTGDTKVVEKSALEGIFINTSGIGKRSEFLDGNLKVVRESRKFPYNWPNDSAVAEEDKIIVSGTVGDHGVALLSFREGYGFESKIKSDAQPLNHMIAKALQVGGITAMKDATRGGVANALNEWAEKSKIGIVVEEDQIPYSEAVLSACEMLGIDPLEVGNEGKAIIAVVPQLADAVLKALKKTEEGKRAAIIGEASKKYRGVAMKTSVGGLRIIEPPVGDPVPRIC